MSNASPETTEVEADWKPMPVQMRETGMIPVLTAVLWMMCLGVSVIGFSLPYARPTPPRKPEPAVQAESLQVNLTEEPLPLVVPDNPVAITEPPNLETLLNPPEVPPMTAVAEASAVAFALPVEGPVRVVEPAKATFVAAAPVAPTAPALPPVQTITYGQGEGRQPAPEYPSRARREGQEGTVGVRFTVAEDGRVLAAEPFAPSAWKLLNDAAVRVVRERWRFPSGKLRLYKVSIRFQLTK